MDVFRAVLSLRPDAKCSLLGNDYKDLIWFDENEFPPPTEKEVLAEAERLESEWVNRQYQRDREIAYPSIGDQLDILYHQGYDGWKNEINKIKDKYPKP